MTSKTDSAVSTEAKTKKCPFGTKEGYATTQGRREWLLDRGYNRQQANEISTSLDADMDTSQPLYFWQLYSLLGQDVIYKIVKTFYEYVFEDEENDWFRRVFERIAPVEHHVLTQTLYWMDVMGGGKYYHGGSYRISFHHEHNAAEIMNARGAKLWMRHMKRALHAAQQENDVFTRDERIVPCIMDFLKVKMKVYAQEHGWEFDEGDFDIDELKNDAT